MAFEHLEELWEKDCFRKEDKMNNLESNFLKAVEENTKLEENIENITEDRDRLLDKVKILEAKLDLLKKDKEESKRMRQITYHPDNPHVDLYEEIIEEDKKDPFLKSTDWKGVVDFLRELWKNHNQPLYNKEDEDEPFPNWMEDSEEDTVEFELPLEFRTTEKEKCLCNKPK